MVQNFEIPNFLFTFIISINLKNFLNYIKCRVKKKVNFTQQNRKYLEETNLLDYFWQRVLDLENRKLLRKLLLIRHSDFRKFPLKIFLLFVQL